ncbi:GAF domain-containing protein [Ahrensia sp. R2A130]|uniref:GAF domain-containing protein n=1 Tax=Ahrensia sp. R2A130 TaxID=744979 RepID=UPI0001E0D88E|nr:GAF domain-containing protein [Ahrensia sp. R2A130]EFL87931.1 adenylate/guanylate cyclase [Ahrensia sp. R2A130]
MDQQINALETLSKREMEIAAAYADGGSNKEIARDLSISPTTVRSHLRTVYGKLGVTSKIALAKALANPADTPNRNAAGDEELTADLALELDEAMRRERMMARVLRIISNKDADLDEVIDEVISQALEICEAEFGVLFEYHGDLKFSEMRSQNITKAFADWLVEQNSFEVEPFTGLGRVATRLETVNIADLRSEGLQESGSALRVATCDLGHARSFAAIPMMAGDRLLGTFCVYRTRVHPFNERALELAQAFADQAAIALENSRQFNELQERLDRTAATQEVLEAISNSRDDEAPVFDVILRNARALCDAPFAALALATAEDAHQVMAAHHGAVASTVDLYAADEVPMDAKRSFAARAIIEKRTIHLADMRDTPEYREGVPNMVAICDGQGIRTNLFVPLVAGGKGIGCFIIFRNEVHPYSDEQVALVETFAAQAVIAIENVRQFNALQTRLERAKATHEVLEAIRDSRQDEGPVLDVILRRAAELCGADSAALTLGKASEDTRQRLAAAFDMHPKTRALYTDGKVSMNPETSLVARAIVTGQTLHVPDYADTDDYRAGEEVFRSLVDDTGLRTSLNVPLLSGGKGIGALVLYRKSVKPYAADQIALVETFAAQAVIALENVEQFKTLKARTAEVQALNAGLESKVADQVREIARMGQLKQFMSPAVADAFISSGDDSALKSHRAMIATLFCDIRGFTAFCESAEPEETIEVLQSYHEEMGNLIAAHGGGVDKRMGDGIMVIFNDPLPHEDPAGEAVRLAIAMRGCMERLCAKWKRLGHRLGFGVGISLGYATVGMVGSEGRFDYTASGTVVNTAARLCDLAEDGEILLSPRAWAAVEDEFEASSKGEAEIKGIREPVELFSIKAAA